jgi:hypothetical protein
MPKPDEIFLLEVSYPDGSYYNAPGGGIFRTERDMLQRIRTVESKAASKKKRVKLTTSRAPGFWAEYHIGSGVCHCGSDMEGHPIWDNHAPTEMMIT